jgi:hypothetical protein
MDDSLLTKSELAQKLLREMFTNRNRVTIAEAASEAAKLGISRKTLTEARKAIGATEIHNGPHPGFWQAPADGGR